MKYSSAHRWAETAWGVGVGTSLFLVLLVSWQTEAAEAYRTVFQIQGLKVAVPAGLTMLSFGNGWRLGASNRFILRNVCVYPSRWLIPVLAGLVTVTLLYLIPCKFVPIAELPLQSPSMPVEPKGLADLNDAVEAAVYCLLSIGCGSFLGFNVKGRSNNSKSNTVTLENSKGGGDTSENSIGLWLKTDNPIIREQQDRFAHGKIAKRVFDYCSAHSSVAIVGPFGSGKSSVLSLAQRIAATENSPLKFVAVSAWNSSSVSAAALGILNALVQEFRQHACATSVSGVPVTYLRAFEGYTGKFGKTLSQFVRPPTVDAALLKLDKALGIIGVHFVLCIEDLERLEGGEEKHGPIRSLLYQLDRLAHVTVVVASTSIATRFDVEKLARHVEKIPCLNPVDTYALLAEFKTWCLREWPTRSDEGLEFNGLDTESAIAAYKTNQKIMSPEEAMSNLVTVPRLLKQALTHCSQVWKTLSGDIDFDHVLAMGLIRSCAPEVIDLVDKWHGPLRHYKSAGTEDSNVRKKFFSELQALVADEPQWSGPNEHRYSSLETVLTFVLEPKLNAGPSPQGIFSLARNYWNRLLSNSPLPDEQRDEPLLLAVKECIGGDAKDLGRLFVEARSPQPLETFCRTLDETDLMLVFDTFLLALSGSTLPTMSVDSGQPGFRVWRELYNRRTYMLALPNMPHRKVELAQKVLNHWEQGRGVELSACVVMLQYLSEGELRGDCEIGTMFLKSLVANYGQTSKNDEDAKSARLIEALQSRPARLIRLAFEVCAGEQPELSGNAWTPLLNTIAHAVKQAPTVMLAPLSQIWVEFSIPDDAPGTNRPRFAVEHLEELFGSNAAILLSQFAKADELSDHYTVAEKRIFDLAREYARCSLRKG